VALRDARHIVVRKAVPHEQHAQHELLAAVVDADAAKMAMRGYRKQLLVTWRVLWHADTRREGPCVVAGTSLE
jgi:hypothetical protein